MSHLRGGSGRWPGRRGLGAAAAAAGLVLLAAAAMVRDRSAPTDFGATWAPAPLAGAATLPGAGSVGAAKLPGAGSVGAALDPVSHGSSPSRRPAAIPRQQAAPSQVTIPKIGVQAEVQPVLTSNGQLDVPADPARLGWWTGSAPVGAATGTVVIDGHVDSAATGPGALFLLTDLRTSDRIVVTTVDGLRQDYRVIGRRAYVKANGLPPQLFSTAGPPRLMLITCGGPFDRTALSYLDNIVIFATPTAPGDTTRP